MSFIKTMFQEKYVQTEYIMDKLAEICLLMNDDEKKEFIKMMDMENYFKEEK